MAGSRRLKSRSKRKTKFWFPTTFPDAMGLPEAVIWRTASTSRRSPGAALRLQTSNVLRRTVLTSGCRLGAALLLPATFSPRETTAEITTATSRSTYTPTPSYQLLCCQRILYYCRVLLLHHPISYFAFYSSMTAPSSLLPSTSQRQPKMAPPADQDTEEVLRNHHHHFRSRPRAWYP